MSSKKSLSSKKDQAPLRCSVMLTRFKLSQQKGKLKEKDDASSRLEQVAKTPSKATKTGETKTSKINKSPTKKKEKIQKQETVELCPHKIKRVYTKKKIVLKPNHKLKVIGSSNGVKRKLNASSEETNSTSPKRKKTGQKSSKSSSPGSDRSQSPMYSELGFDEVMRMTDENQNLNDEDLMEILTCPSPVWWEDPPDEDYIEGPIILKLNKSTTSQTIIAQRRSKSSRKKTPQKILIESSKSEDLTDMATMIDSESFNNRNKSDHKFNNKRSKLENLLSTIKNKLNDPKTQEENKEMSQKEPEDKDEKRNSLSRSKEEILSESLEENSLFPDFAIHDNDGLKRLENIEIPIENKKRMNLGNESTDNTSNFNVLPGKNNQDPTSHFKLFRGKPVKYVKNKKLKILNIRKMSPELLNFKGNLKNVTLPTSIEGIPKIRIDGNCKNQIRVKSVKNINLLKDVKESKVEKSNLTELDNSSTESKISEKELAKGDEGSSLNSEEYMTIFKIISNDEIQKSNQSEKNSDVVNTDETLLKDVSGTDELVIDKEGTDKSKLNSYYKICKHPPRNFKKLNNETEDKVPKIKDEIEDNEELCDNCDTGNKTSIIVPSTEDIKYCLKCSSIFDMDTCNYCLRKESNDRSKATTSDSQDSLELIRGDSKLNI
ncbi:uncharacterized protein MCAP_0864-like [Battus philenor]|uniref:uncharacterized protein MCAP_0864-like n=1 Tax=Battus philenor TaxID=42288 RepID=UPI0035D072B7